MPQLFMLGLSISRAPLQASTSSSWASSGKPSRTRNREEFNLIRHFTDTAIGYHVLPIVQLLILFFILLVLDSELSVAARAVLAIFAFLNASILHSFSGLVLQERDVLFFLGCLVLSVK